MQALVTGAGGFVGSALAAALGAPPRVLRLGTPDWEREVDAAPLAAATVFHLAARVHQSGPEDEAAFHRDNALKTRRLAEAAVQARARRIVLLSTVKVLGEETRGRPFTVQDAPAPQDAYARSKAAAEEALREVAGAGGVEWVIVRAPLVLGPGARGNLPALMRLCDSGWPLPFDAIANRRSFVQRDDLARLLVACATDAGAAGRTFLAAHPVALSTPQLLGAVRQALGRPRRLWPLPAAALEGAAAVAGMGERMRRLTRSLEVDPSAAIEALGWRPRGELDLAASEMARAWKAGWH